MSDILTRRLTPGDTELAIDAFRMMAAVFEDEGAPLSRGYVDRLLERADFWAFVALAGQEVVGGLTAHALPMTRAECSEMFIYDVAVRPDYQRQGVGRRLMAAVRDTARDQGIDVFVGPTRMMPTRSTSIARWAGRRRCPRSSPSRRSASLAMAENKTVPSASTRSARAARI